MSNWHNITQLTNQKMTFVNQNGAASSGRFNKQPINEQKNLLRVAYLSMEPKTGLLNLADQVDGQLVTHVILAFARVDPVRGTLVLNKPEDKLYLNQVRSFKQKFPHLRVLISVNDEPTAEANTTRASSTTNQSVIATTLDRNSQSKLSGQLGDGSIGNTDDNFSINHDNCNTNDIINRRASSGDERAVSSSNLHHLHNVPSIHSGAFNKLAQSSQLRQKFARSAMEFLKIYCLDGIDIDWEFPNFPHYFGINRDYERTGLTKIMMELKSAIVEDFFDRQVAEQHQFNNNASNNNNNNNNHNNSNNHQNNHLNQRFSPNGTSVMPHLLTIAIGAQDNILRFSYELKSLSNLCDWFNVMSYDYYMFKAYSPFTGPNAPLKPIVDPFVPVLGKLSFQSTLNKLISEDLDRDKIIMGVPTYARAYRLLFKNSHPAPLTLAYGSRSGLYSSEYLSYQEVCQMLEKPETIVDFDKRARVPYLLTDDGYTWVSYENEQSVREKVELIVNNQLGGYMTWNLNSDFFQQFKGDTNSIGPEKEAAKLHNGDNFPLHRALLAASIGPNQ